MTVSENLMQRGLIAKIGGRWPIFLSLGVFLLLVGISLLLGRQQISTTVHTAVDITLTQVGGGFTGSFVLNGETYTINCDPHRRYEFELGGSFGNKIDFADCQDADSVTKALEHALKRASDFIKIGDEALKELLDAFSKEVSKLFLPK